MAALISVQMLARSDVTPSVVIGSCKRQMKTLLKLTSLFLVTLLCACSSPDRFVSEREVKQILQIYFQERVTEVDCIGDNLKFRFVRTGLENTENSERADPEQAMLRFSAQLFIDKKQRTIVGNLNVSAVATADRFGERLGFVISLKEWSFVSATDEVSEYCRGHSNLRVDLSTQRPFRFAKHNTDFGYHRYQIELQISHQLCQIGELRHCQFIDDYVKVKIPRNAVWRDTEQRKSDERKRDMVKSEFANRYYKRLCDYGVTDVCDR